MLVIDWFMWRFPQDRKFLDSKKKLLCENLTTPNIFANYKFISFYCTLITFHIPCEVISTWPCTQSSAYSGHEGEEYLSHTKRLSLSAMLLMLLVQRILIKD